MTADVVVVGPDDSLMRVRDLMDERRIRHVPVADEHGELLGLVSERDLLRRAAGRDTEFPLSLEVDVLATTRVGDVMTSEVETVEMDEDAAIAAQLMLENKYGCLPVVEDGRIAGILTESDFVRLLASRCEVCDTGRQSDAWPVVLPRPVAKRRDRRHA
jgi:CBS domain-containing membrane protein